MGLEGAGGSAGTEVATLRKVGVGMFWQERGRARTRTAVGRCGLDEGGVGSTRAGPVGMGKGRVGRSGPARPWQARHGE